MFLILTLIIAVAAFNLVSTLVMTVTDKQADIAILRTLGASPRSIMKIFMVQGALVGIARHRSRGRVRRAGGPQYRCDRSVHRTSWESEFLSKDIYLISSLPSDLRWPDVGAIGGGGDCAGFSRDPYPSWSAARVKPAEALRYE